LAWAPKIELEIGEWLAAVAGGTPVLVGRTLRAEAEAA
jgi:hypothetical protein